MRFNRALRFLRSRQPNAMNLAGGQAHAQSDKLEFVSLLLTSFLTDQFYRSADVTAKRITDLVAQISDKRFVAKAAIYARNEAGMRSVTHLVAGELASSVKGEEWTKRFYERVVRRPDDALEILAYLLAIYGKPLPNSLKRGLGRALTRFDGYQLAKYRKDRAGLKLVDAVNLLHPPHTEALGKLVSGELAPAETWETKLTAAGQTAVSEEDKADRKAEAWADLIRSRRIGYFALLRNLRNILEQAPDVTEDAIKLLTDEKLIRQSLVLPFRFRTAVDAVSATTLKDRHKVISALSIAVDQSLSNAPRFAGRTLIAMDCSGSMIGQPMKIGSLFASVLYKTCEDADLLLFSGSARYETFDTGDATLTIASRIEEKAEWSGTNFPAIFQKADPGYDRIVILSDMQAWMGHWTPREAFTQYVTRSRGKRPRVYSFDLAGHGTMQFPERDVCAIAGFSDKALETMRFLEEDKTALLQEIERIEL